MYKAFVESDSSLFEINPVLKTSDEKIIAVGQEAKEMLGRAHSGIEIIRPLKDGTIADYRMTDAMIQGFMRKISRS